MAVLQTAAPRSAYDELDRRIAAVQKSTRTSASFMLPAHDWMRQRSKIYYNWHLLPYANTLHWIAFGVMVLGIILGITISYYIM